MQIEWLTKLLVLFWRPSFGGYYQMKPSFWLCIIYAIRWVTIHHESVAKGSCICDLKATKKGYTSQHWRIYVLAFLLWPIVLGIFTQTEYSHGKMYPQLLLTAGSGIKHKIFSCTWACAVVRIQTIPKGGTPLISSGSFCDNAPNLNLVCVWVWELEYLVKPRRKQNAVSPIWADYHQYDLMTININLWACDFKSHTCSC